MKDKGRYHSYMTPGLILIQDADISVAEPLAWHVERGGVMVWSIDV